GERPPAPRPCPGYIVHSNVGAAGCARTSATLIGDDANMRVISAPRRSDGATVGATDTAINDGRLGGAAVKLVQRPAHPVQLVGKLVRETGGLVQLRLRLWRGHQGAGVPGPERVLAHRTT